MHSAQVMSYLESCCIQLLWNLGIFRVPVNLEAIAQHLGVCKIVREPMDAWGFVERKAGRTVIHLRQGVPEVRDRFSLAHELGHVLLERLRTPDSSRDYLKFRQQVAVSKTTSEEMLADHLAGCLLLPSWHLRPFLSDRLDLQAIHRAAIQARASLAAGMFRTVWMSTEPCVAFQARVLPNGRRRVMWQTASASVPTNAVREDLNDALVLQALLQGEPAEASGLRLRWIDSQVISRPNLSSPKTMDFHCLARVRRGDTGAKNLPEV